MSLRVERQGSSAVLTIDRPHAKNALDRDLAARIGDAVSAAGADESVRAVVLTATGGDVFMSGGDLKELAEHLGAPGGADAVLAMGAGLAACATCDVPVIAAVQGDVLGGGCELVLLCDLIVVERHARFAFRHARMGLSPAWGATSALVEAAGPLEAARLLFTADPVDAVEAVRIGLANEVVDTGASRARALEIAGRIAQTSRASVAAMKRCIREAKAARLGPALEAERAAFRKLWGGPDHVRAMEAFVSRARTRS